MDQPTTTATSFVVVVGPANLTMAGLMLAGPRTPRQVKQLGYGFTAKDSYSWPFPTADRARAKARIVERHMSWAEGTCTVKAVTEEGQA